MKLHYPGDKGRAICDADGRVSTTFAYRDVPLSDGSGTAKQILVGICDNCGRVVSIPPQSTPAIKAARGNADISIEAVLPAVYLDALDLACYRIDPTGTQEFRKRLLMYYVHRSAGNKSAARRIVKAMAQADAEFLSHAESTAEKRRLSMKVSPLMSRSIDWLLQATKLSKTDLIKALVVQIGKDIVKPRQPANLKELQALATVAGC